MLERLSAHEPLLINIIGHSVGAILFALFLYLVWRDPVGTRLRASRLSVAAAALALIWNAASVAVIGLWEAHLPAVDLVSGIGTTALNLLPAVLLHLALGGRHRILAVTGYLLSAIAVGIHWSEFILDAPEFHADGLIFSTVSFGALTVIAAIALLRSRETGRGQRTRRLLGTMALFLFALSFLHFGAGLRPEAWPVEVLIHHAGIPLALFVLLQDFRFVLLDAFVRVLANLAVAGITLGAGVKLGQLAGLEFDSAASPFRLGMLLVGAALALVAFATFRAKLQRLLTRILFRRTDLDEALAELRGHEDMPGHGEYLSWAADKIARYMAADCRQAGADQAAELKGTGIVGPILASEAGVCRESLELAGAEVVFSLRLGPDDIRYYLLGRRPGGRPYLSEDLAALARLAGEVADHIKHYRELEMTKLLSQAELEALQAQIHPHFLFNALNTLYGLVPREAPAARRTVLNLSDILRYFLQSGRTYIPLEEELKIVRAYLEIEQSRLGDRLRAEVEADPETLALPIPMLSVQPLVENAIRHGIAAQAAGGRVAVKTRAMDGQLDVRVTDSGPGFQARSETARGGHGVGLDNVRRRLRLCYGASGELEIESGPEGATVGFRVPARAQIEVAT